MRRVDRIVRLMLGATQFAMTANSKSVPAEDLKQAIIVIRHADDPAADRNGVSDTPYVQKDGERLSAKWRAICPSWPQYTNIHNKQTTEANQGIENGFLTTFTPHTSVTVFQHGLTAVGELQAERLSKELSGILATRGFSQVKRAITLNPCPDAASPNPFDTIYPFLKNDPTFTGANNVKDKGKLLLIDNQSPKTSGYVADGFQAMLDTQSLLPAEAEGGGSTLLCWEGHALMGDSIKDPKSVLCQLAGATLTNMGACGTQITKGNVLYIFTKRDGSDPGTSDPKQDYNLDIYEVLANSPNEIGKLTWTYSYVVTRTGDFPTVTTTVLQYSKDLERSK